MKKRRFLSFILCIVLTAAGMSVFAPVNAETKYIYRFVDSTDDFVKNGTYIIARYNAQEENHLLGVDYSQNNFNGDGNARGVKDFPVTMRYSESYGWYFNESDIPAACVFSADQGRVFGNNGYYLKCDLNLHFESGNWTGWTYIENATGSKRITGNISSNEYCLYYNSTSWQLSAGRTKTANLFVREKISGGLLREDYAVIDYSVPALIDVLDNDDGNLTLMGFTSDITKFSAEMNTGVYNTRVTTTAKLRKKYDDSKSLYLTDIVGNKLKLTVLNMRFTEPFTIYYEVKTSEDKYMYSSVTVYPANTVYYEDKLYDSDPKGAFIEYSGDWEEKGTAFDSLNIAGNVRHYGKNDAYSACTGYSGGSAHVMSVDGTTTLDNSPTASFTFTGTGFDIIAQCGSGNGIVAAYVYEGDSADGNADVIYRWIADTYYGYELTRNGWYKYTWKFVQGEWKCTARDNSETAQTNAEFPRDADEGAVMYTYEPRYTYDTVDSGNIEQCGIMKSGSLTYGTYTVVLKSFYSEFFDHRNAEGYDFVLDAVRIYNPALNSASVKARHAADGEDNAEFYSLRDMLISADALGDGEECGVVFVDGIGAAEDIETMKKFGPANEIYLSAGQSIGFELDAGEDIASVQLGARVISGNAQLTVNGGAHDLSSASDMYFDITSDIAGDEDGYVIVRNSGSGILSLTSLKITCVENNVLTGTSPVFVTAGFRDDIARRIGGAYVEDNSEEAIEAEGFRMIYMSCAKVNTPFYVRFVTPAGFSKVKLQGIEAEYLYTDTLGNMYWRAEVSFDRAGKKKLRAFAVDASGNATAALECTVAVNGEKVKLGIGNGI